jgi:uncharacterized protein (DUF1697 family)
MTSPCAPRELGFGEVSSFLVSGNLVFDAAGPHQLETRIETALEAALGYAVEAFIRDAVEVAGVAARQPFPSEAVAASTGKPQVTFLRRVPAAADVEAVLAHASEADRIAVMGREWH